eukprot:s3374_g1.t1
MDFSTAPLPRLQARVRGWKARLDVHPTGPKEKSRTLNDGEQIAVSIQNISIKNVPEVNLMGGVDPFLEVQCGFSKDPDEKGRTSASKDKVDRTEVLSGDTNPKFSKTLDLPRVYNKPDQFMNFLVFDSGTAEDTFIASKSLSVNKLLEGISVFDLQNPPKPIPQELVFVSAVSTKKDIKAKFDVVICEAMKFVFNIKSGEKFPEVDSFGGIDSFIELRATRSDVRPTASLRADLRLRRGQRLLRSGDWWLLGGARHRALQAGLCGLILCFGLGLSAGHQPQSELLGQAWHSSAWTPTRTSSLAALGPLRRLRGRAQQIALNLRFPDPTGHIDVGDAALVRLSVDEVIDPTGAVIQRAIPSGPQALLSALRAAFGEAEQLQATRALETFFEFRRGRLPISEWSVQWELNLEEAVLHAGLEVNQVAKTYLFFKSSCLPQKD